MLKDYLGRKVFTPFKSCPGFLGGGGGAGGGEIR